MFEAVKSVRELIKLSTVMVVSALFLLSPSLRSQNACFEEDWRWNGFGQQIDNTQFYDFDGDGIEEIITVSYTQFAPFVRNYYWHILKYNTTSENYEMEYVSNLYATPIADLQLEDYNEDGTKDICLLLKINNTPLGAIEIIDGINLNQLKLVELPIANNFRFLRATDLEGDGEKEWMYTSDNEIFVRSHDLSTQINYLGPINQIDNIQIGDVDDDSELEIVIGNANTLSVYEFSNNAFSLSWYLEDITNNNESFSGAEFIEISDFNADGRNEILVGYRRKCELLDARLKKTIWSYEETGGFMPIGLFDYNGDNKKDLICVSGFDTLKILEIPSGNTLYKSLIYTGGVYSNSQLYIRQLIKDGPLQLIGDGDLFSIFQVNSGSIERLGHGPSPRYFSLIRAADLNLDGKKELISTGSIYRIGLDHGGINIHNSANDPHVESINLAPYNGGDKDLLVENVDDDPQPEIILVNDKIIVVDGISKEIQTVINFWPEVESAVVLDFDRDGEKEILVSSNPSRAFYEGPYLQSINLISGDLISAFPHITQPIYSMAKGDLDADGNDDLVAFFFAEGLKMVSTTGLESFDALEPFTPYSIYISNIDSDPQDELIIGTSNGRIVAYDALLKKIEKNVKVSDTPILSMKSLDLNSDGIMDIAFLLRYSINFVNLSTLKVECSLIDKNQFLPSFNEYFGGPEGVSSAPYAYYNGPNLEIGDFNNDGKIEMLVSSIHAIFHYSSDIDFITSNIDLAMAPNASVLSVTPNPSSDEITFDLQNSDFSPLEKVLIYDYCGRPVFLSGSREIGIPSNLDISSYVSGMYFVVATTKNGKRYSARFCKI